MAKPIPLLAALLVSVALVPAPAMARDHGMGKAVQQLNDPQFQDTIASAMASLSEAMMGMKMAPFAKAMEGLKDVGARAAGDEDAASGIDPNATLGDMMGADARDMPQQMARQVPQMMGAMAGLAGALEAMLPQFEELGKRLKRQLPRR
jgi:hypothetical protein